MPHISSIKPVKPKSLIEIVEAMPDLTPEEIEERKNSVQKPKPEEQTSPISTPTGNMIFVTDENIFKEINKYLAKEHPKLENKLTFADNIMKNSNTYLAVAVDEFCKKYLSNYRIAIQKDLETNLNMFKGFYIDSGLALRSLTEPNSSQANYLFEQLKERGIKLENLPIFLNLRGLKLDSNLNFNLTDESSYKLNANCLNWKDESFYSQTDNFGLPKEIDENSLRKIWTIKDGLSGVYLGGGGGLFARFDYLVGSGDDGRVVFVSNSEGIANALQNPGGTN